MEFVNYCNIVQRSDISPYQQVCTFFLGTPVFEMALNKDIPTGTIVKVALRYVDHPAVDPVAPGSVTIQSRITDSDTGITTSYNVECAASVTLTSTNVFTAGAFVAGVVTLDKVWMSLMHPNQNILLYFDFKVDTFLPKGTRLNFQLPTDFTKVAFQTIPFCSLSGSNKLISYCEPDEGTKAIYLTLHVDFLPNVPMRLSFFGPSNFLKPTYDEVLDNTIVGFSISAVYNAQTLAQTAAPQSLRIFDQVGTQFFTRPDPNTPDSHSCHRSD
jgi:hypothetical protein